MERFNSFREFYFLLLTFKYIKIDYKKTQK